MAKSIFTERTLWLAFATLFLIVSTALAYIWNGLQIANESVHKLEDENKTNQIQWLKISMNTNNHWKSEVAQAYKNGCTDTAIKFLTMRRMWRE